MKNKQKLIKYISNCQSLNSDSNTVKVEYDVKNGAAILQGQCVERMIVTPTKDGFVFDGIDEFGQVYPSITVNNLDGITTWVCAINNKHLLSNLM